MPVGLPDASPVGLFVVGDADMMPVIVGFAEGLQVGLSDTAAEGCVDVGDANEADGMFADGPPV